VAKCISNLKNKAAKRRKFRPKMRQNAFGGRALPGPAGEASALPRPSSRNWGRVPTSKRKGREWEKGRKGMARGKGGRGGKRGKGRTPVPDCESAKMATLKCGGQKSLKTADIDTTFAHAANYCRPA